MTGPGTHLSTEMIQRYRDRALSVAELLALDDHLAACAECCAQVASRVDLAAAHAMLNAAFTAAGPAHLTHEQLAGYVDDTLPDAEKDTVARHLDRCKPCTAEAEELLGLKEQLAGARSAAAAAEPPAPWYARLRAFFRRPAVWPQMQAAAAAAAAVLLIFSLQVRPLLTQLGQQQAALQRQQAESEALRKKQGELLARYQSAQAQNLLQAQQRSADQTRLAELARENGSLQTRLSQVNGVLRTSQERERQLQHAAAQNRYTGPARPLGPEAGSPSSGGLLAFRDGPTHYLVAGDGTVYRAAKADSLSPSVRLALAGRQVEIPAELRQLTGPAPVTRGGGVRFNLLAPVGTRVKSRQPEFRWEPVKSATRYELTLTDRTTESRLLPPGKVTGTSWKPTDPLERGHRYEWQVRAFRDRKPIGSAPQPPDPVARFEVLGVAANDALDRQLEKYKDSPLTQGVLYAQAGLRDDAAREFRLLLAANPHSPIAQHLLNGVRTMPGHGSGSGEPR